MRNVSSPARYAAQAIADQVATTQSASDKGVYIAVVEGGSSSDLFYVIATTANGAHESTRLLCSATSMERLAAHLSGFIENIGR